MFLYQEAKFPEDEILGGKKVKEIPDDFMNEPEEAVLEEEIEEAPKTAGRVRPRRK